MRLLLLSLSILMFYLPSSADAAPRPNVLIVLIDDAGYGDFGCHGHPFLKTPNIDKLHGQSIRFTDFHVAPMCTPTRGQLLTGMDAVRNGATSVTGGRSFIRPGIATLPEMLGAAGYRTGVFGKWHLGDNYPHRPMDKGFQDAVWVKGWGFTSAPEFSNVLIDGRCYRGAEDARFKGYITDFCFDEAMQWMKARKAGDEPFFCYLPLHAAHAPHTVPDSFRLPFVEKAKGAAGFFGMLANIDENMGRLEQFLTASGLRDNTIVIFMTDNGATTGFTTFNAGLRGRKTEFYEGGHRVPCFVRWPAGKLRTPGDLATPTQIQDLAPTLLELTGVKPAAAPAFDGVSLAALLKGGAEQLPDRMFIVQYSRAKLTKWECAVVWGKWRLVHGTELYDVEADRAQKTDLASAKPEVVDKLKAHYEKWWEQLGPAVDTFVPTSIGSAAQPVVQLTSSDWRDVYCDNSNHIRNAIGGPRGGDWSLNVERAGEYEITLRRWPADLNLPLSARSDPASKALPIAAGVIAVGGQTMTVKVQNAEQATQIAFRIKLPGGPTSLQAWFADAAGKDLSGAFYADVKMVGAGR